MIYLSKKEILWAGQTKYRGGIKKAIEWWQEMGINHLMVKKEQEADMSLIGTHGYAVEENFKRLGNLQIKHGIRFHIHPYNLIIGTLPLSVSSISTQDKLARVLTEFDRYIQIYDLYPLITTHPPRMKWPDRSFTLTEEKALDNSLNFYKYKLSGIKSRIAIENMHDPGRNQEGHELLGFKAEHFLKLIGDNQNLGLCVDIGHSLLADEPLENLLKLPYPILSVHLHGNDTTDDQHVLPNVDNVGDLEVVKKVIRKCEGPVVFELRDKDTLDEVRDCISFWQNLMRE